MPKPVAIHFNLATKLRNEKGQFFQSEAKPYTLNRLHYSLRVLVREDSVMTPITNISRPSPHAQYNQGAPTPPATLILRQLIPSASRRTIGLGERLTQTHLPGVIRLRKQSADIPQFNTIPRRVKTKLCGP